VTTQLAQMLLAQADPSSAFGGQNQILFLVPLFFGIFYFMIIRPQQKQQKQLQTYLDGLKKGDEVVTTGGLIGRIDKVADGVLTLEIAQGVKVRVMKTQVVSEFKLPEPKSDAKVETKADVKTDAPADKK
jgi:preprotein translocase subunit YajC